MEYYNNKIKLDLDVIKDILRNTKETKKMLVFGLGYDSIMWYKANNNTYFIENNDEYIKLNINEIPSDHIIKYEYKITCKRSISLKDYEIEKFFIPEKILELAPFDIILIDGPEGWSENKPGRLIPCYWSTLLSKPRTLIYIDDSSRKLESYCIKKYFSNKVKEIFLNRNKCTKIFM